MADSVIVNEPNLDAVNVAAVPAEEPESARSMDVAKNGPTTRVWLLTNLPSPYQVELLSRVNRLENIELHVRFMRIPPNSALSSRAEAGLVYRELWGAAPKSWRDEVRLHPRAICEAAFGKFDCFILSGLYTSITFLICSAILTMRRKPWAVWLEQPRVDKYQVCWGRGRLSRRLLERTKHAAMRFLMRCTSRVMGMGTAALRAYQTLGATPEKLLLFPYCCNVERFALVDREHVARVRDRFQLEGKSVFLYSGQMIERKGVDTVLRAFERLAERHRNVALLLLGDGPSRNDYEKSVPPHLRSLVHFTGFLNQAELPAHFAAADVFVFASRHDGWGVVVNEACAAGLPIIVSRQTGAALDLVEEERNGYVLDCEDIDGFAERMAAFVENPQWIALFGQRSRERVQPFSTEQGAKRFYECVVETIGAHSN